MQPRDRGPWWRDQHGGEWSAFALWKEATAGVVEMVVTADGVGARLYRRDDELLHLVRIPPPESSPAERRAFVRRFDRELSTRFDELTEN